METLEKRIKKFSKDLRASKISIYRNVMSCCRSCVNLEDKIGESGAIIWSFGGQGCRVSIVGDEALGYDSRGRFYVDQILFNHTGIFENGELNENGREIKALAEENGLVFNWDEVSPSRVLTLNIGESA